MTISARRHHCKDALGAERELMAGLLECPACGGRLAGCAHAWQQLVFGTDQEASATACPLRGGGVIHVLLPVSVLLRLRDAVTVIGTAL